MATFTGLRGVAPQSACGEAIVQKARVGGPGEGEVVSRAKKLAPQMHKASYRYGNA